MPALAEAALVHVVAPARLATLSLPALRKVHEFKLFCPLDGQPTPTPLVRGGQRPQHEG